MNNITTNINPQEECFNTSYFYNKAMNVRKERHSKFDIAEMMITPTKEFMVQYPVLVDLIKKIDREAGNGHLRYHSWIRTYYFPDNEDMERKLLVACLRTLGFKVEISTVTGALTIYALAVGSLEYSKEVSYSTTKQKELAEVKVQKKSTFISDLFKHRKEK